MRTLGKSRIPWALHKLPRTFHMLRYWVSSSLTSHSLPSAPPSVAEKGCKLLTAALGCGGCHSVLRTASVSAPNLGLSQLEGTGLASHCGGAAAAGSGHRFLVPQLSHGMAKDGTSISCFYLYNKEESARAFSAGFMWDWLLLLVNRKLLKPLSQSGWVHVIYWLSNSLTWVNLDLHLLVC